MAAIETHEMFLELIESGFTEKVAAQIVANILYDIMASRFADYDDDEDDQFDADFREPKEG